MNCACWRHARLRACRCNGTAALPPPTSAGRLFAPLHGAACYLRTLFQQRYMFVLLCVRAGDACAEHFSKRGRRAVRDGTARLLTWGHSSFRLLGWAVSHFTFSYRTLPTFCAHFAFCLHPFTFTVPYSACRCLCLHGRAAQAGRLLFLRYSRSIRDSLRADGPATRSSSSTFIFMAINGWRDAPFSTLLRGSPIVPSHIRATWAFVSAISLPAFLGMPLAMAAPLRRGSPAGREQRKRRRLLAGEGL